MATNLNNPILVWTRDRIDELLKSVSYHLEDLTEEEKIETINALLDSLKGEVKKSKKKK